LLLSDANFNEVISSNKTVLVDFWADWCGPCKRMEPIIEEFESETGIPVGKLNVDQNFKIPVKYSIQSIPTMVLFRDGDPVHTIVGAMPKHRLMKELAEWI